MGLDPELEKIPAPVRAAAAPIFEFNRRIVDATAQYACCFKPQFAHYAALGAEDQLLATIRYIHEKHPGLPVILDSKRGDIGSTAAKYAQESFERYGADAVDGESVPGVRFDRAVPEVAGSRRDHPVPHVQSRRARFPGPGMPTASACIAMWPSAWRATGTAAGSACW